MRADMAKVLVERPRVRSRFVHGLAGKGYKTRVRQAMESDDGSPVHEPTMRMYNHNPDKHFNEHLGPLRRFISANVGRPWAKVYSEICRHVDRGNVVQKHILTHLFEYVVVDVELINGEPHRKPHERRYSYRGQALRGPNQWYVCPNSGVLKAAKPRSRKERRPFYLMDDTTPENRPIGWIDGTHFVRKCVNGGYELATVRPWPPQMTWGYAAISLNLHDVLFRSQLQRLDPNKVLRYYGRKVYAIAVRTLRHSELKHLPITLPRSLTAPNLAR